MALTEAQSAEVDSSAMLDESRFLPEVARMIFVWRCHQMEPATEEVLCHWARSTAPSTRTPPTPRQAVIALQSMGLMVTNERGECVATPALLAATGDNFEQPEQVSFSLGLRIFERMVADDRFRFRLESAFRWCRIRANGISADWARVPTSEKHNLGWIWLQQLGLGRHDGSALHLALELESFVLDADGDHGPLTQEDLDRRLAAQRRRALLAEQYVVSMEKERLCAAGAPELAEAVRRISDEDVTAGYDVLSFDSSGPRRLVEVKSSSGPRTRFIWSRNEYRCAVEQQAAYWIAWVERAFRLPNGPCNVAWFQNPAALLEEQESPWEVGDGDLWVCRRSDDSAFTADP